LHTNSTGIPDAVLAGPHCEGGWSDIFAEAGILAAAVSGMPGVVFLPFSQVFQRRFCEWLLRAVCLAEPREARWCFRVPYALVWAP